MPMVRCAACDAPNVDDRVTCWRCLRDLDADPAERGAAQPAGRGAAQPAERGAEAIEIERRTPLPDRLEGAWGLPDQPDPALVGASTAQRIEAPVGASTAERILVPVGASTAEPIEGPLGAPAPEPLGRSIGGRVTPPVAVPVRPSTEVTVTTRAPTPVPRPIVLSTWPSQRSARRGVGRALLVASIALLLVLGIAGVAFLNLAMGGANDAGREPEPSGRDLLAALLAPSAEPAAAATPAPVAQPSPVDDSGPADAASTASPAIERSTGVTVEAATQVVVSPEGTTTAGVPAGRAPRGNAFTCGGAAPDPIRDLRDRTWRVRKVSFRGMGGFERVIIHLDRLGDARTGDRTMAIAGRVSTNELAELPSDVRPERERRGLLRIALAGVPEGPELRAFRPLGIGSVGELSLLPGRNGRTALLTIDHDACYRIRVPEWGPSGSDDARRAEVVIDIRD
jgi:hypothetical protein